MSACHRAGGVCALTISSPRAAWRAHVHLCAFSYSAFDSPAFSSPPSPLHPTGRDPSAVLEQLCWVVSMAAHVLADAGDGETPLVPVAILEACTLAWAAGGQHAQQAQQVGEDPAVALGRCLLGVGAMCLDEAARPVISPR